MELLKRPAALRRRAARERFGWRVGAACLALASLAGCVDGYRRACPVLPALPPIAASPAAPSDVVDVHFLGVGGFLIRRTAQGRSDAVLTAPLYSHPTLGEIALQEVYSDHRLIDALLPPQVSDVSAVLSGHAHYDHLMDVPRVVRQHARQANVYGNDAARDLLAPLARWSEFEGEVVSLQSWANPECLWSGSCKAGTPAWRPYPIPNTHVRVWVILSEHSPQFSVPGLLGLAFPHPVHLWRGQPYEPADHLPTRPSGWPEGTALAYVIDFLDVPSEGADEAWNSPAVAFRVYYQDTGTRAPYGHPPLPPEVPREVDLALVCVGGTERMPRHPADLLRDLRPRFALGHHWENFFNPRTLPLPARPGAARVPHSETFYGLPRGKAPRFERRMGRALEPGTPYALPCPDAVTRFVRNGRGEWRIAQSTERWKSRRP